MASHGHSIQQDHLPPGIKETGRHEDWDVKFDAWLLRRGFHDELRQRKSKPAFLKNSRTNHTKKRKS